MRSALVKARPRLFRAAGALAERVPFRLGYRLLDLAERRLGFSDALTPPFLLRKWVGAFDDPFFYREVAEAVFRYNLLGDMRLQPSDRLLDVGCGCGQMVAPLARYLRKEAAYAGFDVDAEVIRWCRANITPRLPNFHFQYADIYSAKYNPSGPVRATEFVFPYPDGAFDVAFAKSVFTHLEPAESSNYLAQIARVLAPGGRCWVSCFLLDPESLDMIAAGKSTLDFKYVRAGHRLIDERYPEKAVAHDDQAFLGFFAQHGLRTVGPVRRGSWCGRVTGGGYQDEVMAEKA